MSIYILLSVLVGAFVFMSVVMTFFPGNVYEFTERSVLWRRYLRVIGHTDEISSSSIRIRRIRMQGVISIPFSLLLLYALLKGFPDLRG